MKNLYLPACVLFLLSFSTPLSALDYYWVGGDGKWSEFATHWAKNATPGPGDFYANVPGAADDVYFTNNGGVSYTLDVDASVTIPKCHNMDWSAVPAGTVWGGFGSKLEIYGATTLSANMSISFNGYINMIAFGGMSNIASHGVHFPVEVGFYGTAGGWNFVDDFYCQGRVNHEGGLIETNGHTVTIGDAFLGNYYATNGQLHLGSSEFIMLANTAYFRYNAGQFDAGTSHIKLYGNGVYVEGPVYFTSPIHFNDVSFYGYCPGTGFAWGHVDGTLTFHQDGGIHAYGDIVPELNNVVFLGNGIIYNACDYHHLTLTKGKTYTVNGYYPGYGTDQIILPGGSLTALGAGGCSEFITIKSWQYGTHFNLVNNSGADQTIHCAILEDCHATGSNALIVNDGVDLGNNTGWIFVNPHGAMDLYWIGGDGDWDDPNHWSDTDGGPAGTCLPNGATNVFFTANSGFDTNPGFVRTAKESYCHNMDWTGVTGNPTFQNLNSALFIYGSVTLAGLGEMQMSSSADVLRFRSSNSATIASNGQHLGSHIIFEGNGIFSFLDHFSATYVSHIDGTIWVNGHTMNVNQWYGSRDLSGIIYNRGAELWLGDNNGANSIINVKGEFVSNYEPNLFHALESHIFLSDPCFLYGGGLEFWNVTSLDNGHIHCENAFFHHLEMLGNGHFSAAHRIETLTLTGGYGYQIDAATSQTITAIGSVNVANADCANLAYLFAYYPHDISKIAKESGNLALNHVILDNVYPDFTTGASYSATNSVGLQPQVISDWIITNPTARTLHWVGGAGDWSSAAHWSLNSGGAGGECPPTPSDDAFFDGGSGLGASDVVNLDQAWAFCKNMDWTGGAGILHNGLPPTTWEAEGQKLQVFGGLTFANTMINDFKGVVMLRSKQPVAITSAGNHFKGNLRLWDPAGDWSLNDEIYIGIHFNHSYGKFRSNDFPMTIAGSWYGGATPSMEAFMGNSTVTFNGSNNYGYGLADMYYLSGTFHCGTSNFIFDNGGYARITANGYNTEYYNVTFKGNNSLIWGAKIKNKLIAEGPIVLQLANGDNYIHDAEFREDAYLLDSRPYHSIKFFPGKRYTLANSSTQTILPFNGQEGQFLAQGLPGQYIEIKSDNFSIPAIIHMDDLDGTSTCTKYLFLTSMTHTGTEDIYVPTPGGNVFHNTGWQFFPCNPCPASIPKLDAASITTGCAPGKAKLILQGLKPDEWANWYTDPGAVLNLVYSGGNLFQPDITGPATYYARVYSDGGLCESTVVLTVDLTPIDPPLLFEVTGGGMACTGANVEVGLNGSQGGVDYQLYRDGLVLGNALAGTGLALSFGYQNMAGTYTVVATIQGAACAATMNGSATVAYDPALAPLVQAGSNAPLCLDGQALLLFESGGQAVSWSWTGPDNFMSTDQNPVISNPDFNDAGVYTVMITSANGCANESSVSVILHPAPEVQNDCDLSNCENGLGLGQATFDLRSREDCITLEAAGVEVRYFTDVALTDEILTPEAYLSGPRTVYLLITQSATGCTATGTMQLNVSPAPPPRLEVNSIIRVQAGKFATLIMANLPPGIEAIWYAEDQTTVLYASTANFFQPNIIQPTTFYGATHDPISGCTSELLQVVVCIPDIMSMPVPFSSAPVGDAPGIKYAYAFGADNAALGRMIVALPDSSYVMLGDAINECTGDRDLNLVKSNCSGEIIWQQSYGGQDFERVNWAMDRALYQTADGGFLLLGLTTSYGAGALDGILIKTDALGNQQWAKTYGGTNDDYVRTIAPTSDGGYIISNYTFSDWPSGQAIFGDNQLIKTDATGNIQWEQIYPKPGWQSPYVAIELPNGGYLTAGTFGLTKTDANGNELWERAGVGGIGYILEPTSDGGVLYGGRKYNGQDGFLWRLDGNGDPLTPNETTISGPEENYVYNAKETASGGFMCAGETTGFSADANWDYWFFETDANLNVKWQRTFGGDGNEWCTSFKKTVDGDYIGIGLSDSYGGLGEFLTVKLDIIPDPLPVLDPASVIAVLQGQAATLILQNLPLGYAAVWYDSDQSTELYASADNLFQPQMSGSQYFYGAMREISTGCEGEKIQVLVCAPGVQANSNSPLCAGNDLQFFESGGAAVSWSWAGPQNFGSSEQNPVISNPTYLNSGDYSVVITDLNGCTNSETTHVIVGGTGLPLLEANSIIRVPQTGGQVTLILENLPNGYEAVWYAADQTTILYSSTNNFFQTAVNQPTTFYGATFDPVTGCRSMLLEIGICLFDFSGTVAPFSSAPVGAAPGIKYAYTFGSVGGIGDYGRMIVALPDSTYVMAGDGFNTCAEDGDIYLIKSNCAGDIIWQHAYGGPGNERIQWVMDKALIQTADGGFLIHATTDSYGAGALDNFLIKTDADGNQQWIKTYGGASNDYARGLTRTSDGGYIITDYSFSNFPPDIAIFSDIHLMKTDINGNIQWQRLYPKQGYQDVYATVELSNGGYLTSGSYGLTKVDVNGNEIWQRPGVQGVGYVLENTADGGVMYGGRKTTGHDGFMWKLDGNGDPVWPSEVTIPGPSENYVYVIKERANGNFMCAGETNGQGAGGWDYWFFETDPNGSVIWERTFGDAGNEWATSMKKTIDGDYIAIGLSGSYGNVGKFLTVKLDIIPDPLPILDPASVIVVQQGQLASLILQNLPLGYAAVWYDSDGTTELYASADNLFQPQMSGSQYFYGAMREISTGCEGEKIQVLVCAPGVQANSNSPLCAGNDLQLFESGGAAVSWSWTGPQNFVSGEQNPVISNPTYLNSGDYTVVITDLNGCTNSETIAVVVGGTSVPRLEPNSIIRVEEPGGQAVLILENLPPGYQAIWYAADQTTVLYTSTANLFQTFVNQPTTFYGATYDPVTGCRSALLKVETCLFKFTPGGTPFSAGPLGAAPGIKYTHSFGTTGGEYSDCIIALPDSTYLIAGEGYNHCNGDVDIFLIKSNCSGEILWQHSYGGQEDDAIIWGGMDQTLIPASNGGYLILGSTFSYGRGNLDMILIKVDDEGHQQWVKVYGWGSEDYSRGISPTADGGYIISSYTFSNVPPTTAVFGDIYLIKIDANGNIQWEKQYNPLNGYEDDYATMELANGNFLTTGTFGLMKTDANGNFLSLEPGVSGYNYILQHLSNGDIMYAGRQWNNNDSFLWRLDGNGNPIWPSEVVISGPGGNYVYSIKETATGGFFCAGETDGQGAGGWDYWFFETDPNGAMLWQRTFGSAGNEWCTSLKATSDGDYIATGFTDTYGNGDFMVIKLDIIPDGPPVLDPASVTNIQSGQQATLILQNLPLGYAAVWYDSDQVTELYADDDNLFRPVVNASQYFYGAMREISTGCESDKIPVLVCAAKAQISTLAVVCLGDPILLMETGAQALSWTWSGPNGFLGTTQSVTDPNTSIPGVYTYNVTIRDGFACSATASVMVRVQSGPQVFALTGESIYCSPGDAGAPLRLSGSQTGVRYQVYQNGNPVGAPVAGTGAVLVLGFYPAGIYTVIATSTATGCRAQMSGSWSIQGFNCTIEIADPCSCKNNATNLANGQFDERVKVNAPSWQIWTVKSVSGLYKNISPAPPAAPIAVASGALFNPLGGNMFDLPGILVDAVGYTITATNGTTDLSIPLHTCYYPNPVLLQPGGPYCLNSPDITLAAKVEFNPAANAANFRVNGVNLPASFNPATSAWEANYGITTAGVFQVDFTFDAGAPVANNPADPGCIQQTAAQFFNVIATPSSLICNDLVYISLDANCELWVLPDMVLEGSYGCYDDYLVEIDRTLPYGDGPWEPAHLNAGDIGKTYAYRVTHLPSGNKCWGNLKGEDKLPPALTCEAFTIPCNTPDLSPDYLANILNIPAAKPAAADCQSITWWYVDVELLQNCALGLSKLILRNWTAVDASGNTSTCIQNIGLLRPTLNDVTTPPDYDDIDAVAFRCEDNIPIQNGHPKPTPDWIEAQGLQGYPHVFGQPSGCSINWEWHDYPIEVCDGTIKYRREWSVIDWCIGDGFIFNQIIKVLDETGPDMECPAGLIVSTDPFDCCATINLPDVIVEDYCSRINSLSGMIVVRDPFTNAVAAMKSISGTLEDFAGNNWWDRDTLANFGWTSCLPVGNHTVTYVAKDDCGNRSSCTFELSIQDYTPPVASCDETTTVAIGADDPADCYAPTDGCDFVGVTWVKAAVFNDGSADGCNHLKFAVRRMSPYSACIDSLSHKACYPDAGGNVVLSEFDLAILEQDSIKFYCCEVGTTQTVILSVYQTDLNGQIMYDASDNPIVNECMIQVEVQDKLKPSCLPPAQVTVNCENFDPSLWTYGKATIADNCCLDTSKVYQGQCGLSHSVNYALFDTVCNKGTITRTFRSYDCHGQSSSCTQRVIVTYDQDYFIKFPNDAIVTTCDGTGNFGEPIFFGEDCELLGVSFDDEVFTVVPDACFKIERTWQIINWCTYDPNLPCIYVPNPNPNAIANHATNLPGPTVSACGTLQPWKSTIVKILPTDPLPGTDYCEFWDKNANCYKYKQIIKVADGQAPTGTYVTPDCSNQNWFTPNRADLWNEAYWWDNGLQIHDLCEEPTDLCITGTDACSGSNVNIEYLLFLDLDGNGSMETVINSVNVGIAGLGWNNVLYNNLNSPNFAGGTPRNFDERPVLPNQKYGFAIQETITGNSKTACVRWNTQQQQNTYVIPELPHGTHKIKWFIIDGCGNNKEYEYTFTVKDCKAPTVVCLNGLSVNIMPTGMITLWASDFLQYTEDNCTPNPLKIGIRKCGTGTGFPLDAFGNPIVQVTFTCAEQGNQCVELWAIDAAGNADYCETYVIVQDNLGSCGSGNTVQVSGALKTELDNGIEEAVVSLLGPDNLTDNQGGYHFNNIPIASTFTIVPEKDDNPLNGVTTYDLVLISKHILGLEPLNSPYKMIAADANKSGSITTFDMVEIRKLILGIYTELPNNSSWRFVDKSFQFPNVLNPFQTVFPEMIPVSNILISQPDQDFVGVKIGDVNHTAVANATMQAEARGSGAAIFDLEDREIRVGETFEVDFKSAQAMQGYQFTLLLNGLKAVSIVETENIHPSNFNLLPENAMTVSIDGAQEFTVRFRAEKSGKLSEMLRVSGAITRAEAYPILASPEEEGRERLGVALRFGGKTIAGLGFELYQNQPNPFVNKTSIGFYLPEAAEATLSVYDESGRVVWQQKGQFASGEHSVLLDRALLDTSGLLYYKLETAGNTATKKMIQMRQY